MKHEVFEKELKFITSDDIREFTVRALDKLPDYFYSIPASSTGKYHPDYALGYGGLVRHVKATIYIALELFKMEKYAYKQREQSMILSVLLLHDGHKNGRGDSKYTDTRHPLIQAESILEDGELMAILPENDIHSICDLISTHMGQWDSDFKTGKKELPRPESVHQEFVHLCDYIASRKCLEFNFEVV